MIDAVALQRENAELRALVEKLTMQLAKLNDRVTELLAVAQRRQRKPSAKPDAAARPTPPTLLDDAKRSFEEQPKAPTKPVEPPKPVTPRKPTGRKPLPSHL